MIDGCGGRMKERFCTVSCKLLIFASLMLVPLSVFAQSSFHQLTPGRSILNFNLDVFEKGIYHPTETTERIGGELHYSIKKSTAAIFGGSVTFVDDLDNHTYPPAPTADIAIGQTDLLGQTQLGYFSYLRFEIGTQRTVQSATNALINTALRLGPSLSFGVFKPLNLSPDLSIFPFFGLSYRHLWTTEGVDYEDLSLNRTTGTGDFSGMLGMETEISSRFGLFGALNFSFDYSETMFRMGIRFY